MLSLSFYITCAAIALLGLLLAILLQMRALRDKALAGNLQFPTFTGYLKMEWITVTISLVVIAIGLFFIPIVLQLDPGWAGYIKPAFLPVGYMGTDIILKLFGVLNKRLNSAIESKSLQTDIANGTVSKPTPAAAPQNTTDL